jgi:hypothetical protein
MSFDPRLTPARPDLAAAHLRGLVAAPRYVEGTGFEVFDAVAPVRKAPVPDAMLETEALKGERVTIYDEDGEGWGWGQLRGDGYVGWLPMNALRAPGVEPTHKVAVLRTILFPGRSIKAQPVEGLPLGSRLAIVGQDGDLGRLRAGAPPRAARRRGGGRFRGRRRAFHGRAVSVGRQDEPRHRLLRSRPGFAHRLRHRLPA